MSEEKRKRLFEDFPPVSTSEWEEKIRTDLKGADYEKKLMWQTGEAFTLRPYYRNEDLAGLKHLRHFPGAFPYVRGKQASGNHWRVRQDIRVEDIAAANAKALDILMKGIDSLGFILDEEHSYTRDEIDRLLRNIHAHAVELNFVCGRQAANLLGILDQLVKDYNRDLNQIHGAVDFDPLGRLLTRGRFYENEEKDFAAARDLIDLADHLPHFRVLAVHGSVFHNAGSTTTQELAYALAAGNEYLARLTGLGISVTRIAPRIRFNFATSSNYFMEVAKYRAVKMLWARIVQEYGGDASAAKMNIRAVNSSWNKTLYDPHVNMLRTTTEAMSAILGGVDSLTISPYDETSGSVSDMAERVARNQQLILKEESYLDKVADPSAGSYYIENLTDSLAAAAWKEFQNIEAQGGFLTAVKAGTIQKAVIASAEAKEKAVATRKRVLVGTNQYPNLQESLDLKDDTILRQPVTREEESEGIPVLRTLRASAAFERLRYATDFFVSNGGKRPSVFLLTYGNLAMRKARAAFSTNFFGCAGFQIIEQPGFASLEEGIEAARASQADFVVLCSSDEEYADTALQAFHALKAKARVIVAGNPSECLEKLKAGGLQDFIHLRTNVLEALQAYQKMTGIL